ncbi:MAG: PAS domain-containing protein [Bacteroidota bacterium]
MSTSILNQSLPEHPSLEQLKGHVDELGLIFDNVLDSTLAGYWDWYIKQDYEYMSPMFKKMFGYEDDEIQNHPDAWQKIIHPEDLPGVFEVFSRHVGSKGQIPYDNEVRYFHKDGSIVWVYCRGKVIEWDSQGEPVRMVGCHVDITQLKKAQETQQQFANELKIKVKETEQFAYVASHDLQEPIRTVSSFIKIIEEEYASSFDEEGQQYMQFINTSLDRMTNLIKGLLDYSRLGKERDFSQVDINVMVSEILGDMQTHIRESNAIVEQDKLPILTVYPTEFRLLLQNLISNALKFHKPDSNPRVKISVTKNSDSIWCFSVSDNGIGIAEEHQNSIFEIFKQLHNRTDYEGSGIGLSHCYKIANMHGGEIWVESALEQGSTFYFTVPAQQRQTA